jgi:hypothetical protein
VPLEGRRLGDSEKVGARKGERTKAYFTIKLKGVNCTQLIEYCIIEDLNMIAAALPYLDQVMWPTVVLD